MTSHAPCTHRSTPEARQACRMARRALAQAERLGLVVSSVGDDPAIPQYEIRTERDWDGDTRILITAGFRTPSVSIRQATGHWNDTPWRKISIWIQIMAEYH